MDGSAAEWKLEQVEGLLVASCSRLAAISGVRHAFSTRQAGWGDGAPAGFDLGGADPSAGIERRRRRFVRSAGLSDRRPLALRQVHGSRVVCLAPDRPLEEAEPVEADGVVILDGAGKGRVAAVRTADCVGLLLADVKGRAVAAVHAGWRGVAARIVSRALGELRQRGVESDGLHVALGPAVGRCCYVVGPEVRAAVGRWLGSVASSVFDPLDEDRSTLDLHAALGLQLEREGVDRRRQSRAPWCTACRTDLFFSHRREGERAGRMMALIGRVLTT